MDIADILKAIERYNGLFPRAAVEEAMRRPETITPELLRILEYTIENADHLALEDEYGSYFAYQYALFLVAQFREPRAYPLIVRFARLSSETLEVLLGDFLTERLHHVLASVCDGDITPIKALIEDPHVDKYARSAALRSLLVLVAEGAKTRDEVIAYLKELFDERLERCYGHIWNTLIGCAADLYPEELYDRILAAYNAGFVDSAFITVKNVKAIMARDKQAVLDELHESFKYIRNTVEEMEWWYCFNRTEPTQSKSKAHVDNTQAGYAESALPSPIQAVKIKPNAPCPCGSGRKYKKCCGRLT